MFWRMAEYSLDSFCLETLISTPDVRYSGSLEKVKHMKQAK